MCIPEGDWPGLNFDKLPYLANVHFKQIINHVSAETLSKNHFTGHRPYNNVRVVKYKLHMPIPLGCATDHDQWQLEKCLSRLS